jgi:hypothetical protein
LVLWSLWSRNREGHGEGVYPHQTALSIYDLSDLMPGKLHMTVPLKFRRSANIPSIVVLQFDDLRASEVEARECYRLTCPIRTIVDVNSQT